MLLEHVRHGVRERHVPFLLALRRGEYELPAGHLHLVADMQPTRIEPDLVDRQTENLALPKTTPGAEVDSGAVLLREPGAYGERALRGPWDHTMVVRAGRADTP
ncbi:hypothetical protein GCM10010245_26920 [Streptomyces spectabilis]|nr:hypothetical protein GCM10010245_26920 [Streptomyces spectabilis]